MSGKLMKVFLTLATVVMIASCTATTDENPQINAVTTAANEAEAINDSLQKKLALFVAENQILERIESGETLWTENSEITKLYPIYIAGTDEVVYYECKVETEGKDSGYILVCVTEHDILIPEMAEEGRTLTEEYQNVLGENDFKILRYDWFTSAAESIEATRSSVDGQLLASIGIFANELIVNETSRSADADLYSELRSSYAEEVMNNGAIPPYRNEDIKEYYCNNEQSRGSPDYEKKRTAKLKNETIRWKQSKNSNGYPCGCGNTAWAIVYAYWQQFKGRDKLFVDVRGNSLDLEDYNYSIVCDYDSEITTEENYIYNAQWELFANTNSINLSTWGFNAFWSVTPPVEIKNGLTWPCDMNKGGDYGKNRGYSMSLGWRNYGSDGWRKTTNFIYDSINADKPAILLIATSGLVANHYVVIEKITERYWAKTGEPIEVEFRANFGWGSGSKTIYSLSDKWRGNDFKVSYDVFVPTINN